MGKVKSIIFKTLEFVRTSFKTIDETDLYDLRLIFSELLCNAVLHGNKNDMCKYVSLTIELSEDAVTSTISDEGTGFDYMTLLAEARSEQNLLKENGRGILLVHSLTDSITFNGCGNEIKFNKKVNRNG